MRDQFFDCVTCLGSVRSRHVYSSATASENRCRLGSDNVTSETTENYCYSGYKHFVPTGRTSRVSLALSRRTFSCREIASRTFASASSRLLPWLTQPGRLGTSATT